MDAAQLLVAGRLDEALAELQAQVRKAPARPEHRIFLFQLLALMGEWSRAHNQLKVLGELSASALPMVQTYSAALQCEALRAQVFAGKRTPLVLGEPEAWVAGMFEALRHSANGEHEAAGALRAAALDAAPACAGRLDGAPFEWLMDADPRFGPMLEAMINGKYYWVPLHRVQRVAFDAPADLRDLVWLPAWITLAHEGEVAALLPVRYPGTESQADGDLRRARRTDWQDVAPGVQHGLGQRLLATDSGDYPVLDARLLEIGTADGTHG